MKVVYSRRAIAQIDEILSYIARDNPIAAEVLIARIDRLAGLLGKAPRMGRPTDYEEVRILGVPPYPYVIFYRILAERDEVRILRVRHTARRPLQSYR
jgi:plasmid stabilization system protein ParE